MLHSYRSDLEKKNVLVFGHDTKAKISKINTIIKPLFTGNPLDWLQSLKLFFNVSYHILVASITLVALFKLKTEPAE